MTSDLSSLSSGPRTEPPSQPVVPRTADRRPPRRPWRGTSPILLPPWTRAPWLGFRQPAVLLAVIGAAAILACAASSASLFLSSASSKALQRLVAAQCPDSAWPTIRSQNASGGSAEREQPALIRIQDRSVTTSMTAAGLPRPNVMMVSPNGRLSGSSPTSLPALTVYGTGALQHLPVVQRGSGRGVWISDETARITRTRVGGTTTVNGVRVPVAGIYRDLKTVPIPAFWCSYKTLFLPKSVDSDTPIPRLTVATDESTWLSITKQTTPPTIDWLAPIPTKHLRLHDAQRINARAADAFRRLSPTVAQVEPAGITLAPQAGAGNQNKLPAMARRTALIQRGLHGPVVPIAVGGSLLALLLVGAAGSYWADRRAREVRLLSSRGIGPGALAAKAALELTASAVIGTVLGWGLAYELVRLLGPSGDIDRSAPLTAAGTAAIGLVAGVILLSIVAGLRVRGATERPVGGGPSWVARIPWELGILAAAGLIFLRIRNEEPVRLIDNVAQVNLLLVAFPLLFLLGAAIFVVRLLAPGLPALRRMSARWPVTWYFATRRVTGAPLVSLTLLAAASLPVAVLVYSGAITGTSQTTVDAKASVYAGSDVSLGSTTTAKNTAAIRAVGTPLTRYTGGKLGSEDADVLAVDPDTFARWAFWNDGFADRSLPDLMRAISARRSDGRLPAIVVRSHDEEGSDQLQLGQTGRRLAVVSTVRAFPGQRDPYSDLVVVDARRLGTVDDYVDNQGEVWSTRSAAAVQRALSKQGLVTFFVTTPHTVVDATNYLAVSWTFDYLEALAVLVGLIAIGGLLLYLATRQRSRIASYAMTRRMGLTRRRHLRSLVLELLGLLGTAYVVGAGLAWIAVELVYRRLDVDPDHRPPPLLTVPTAAFVGAAVAVVLVAVVAGVVAQRAADAANPSEVMRLDA